MRVLFILICCFLSLCFLCAVAQSVLSVCNALVKIVCVDDEVGRIWWQGEIDIYLGVWALIYLKNKKNVFLLLKNTI